MLKTHILRVIQTDGPIALSRLVHVICSIPGFQYVTETAIQKELSELVAEESVFKTYANRDIYLEIN